MPGFDRSGTKPICIEISWVNSTRLGSVPGEIQRVDGHNHIMSSASACRFAGHRFQNKEAVYGEFNNCRLPNRAGSGLAEEPVQE